MPEPIRSTLAVLLHADVVGSTRLVQTGEVEAHTRMREAFAELSAAIRERQGVVHEIRGDALVAEFSRPSDAVLASLAFQQQRQRLHGDSEATTEVPKLRVGIAMGEVVIADGTITGAGVVLAQRLEQLAPAGGVCVSEAIREAMPLHLPCNAESLGPQQLKGFDTPVAAHLLSLADDASLPPSDARVSSQRRARWVRAVTALAVVVVLMAGAAYLLTGGLSAPTGGGETRTTLAVTAFADRQAGGDDAYLGAGIAEDIATDLTRVDALRIVYHRPRPSSAGEPPTPPEVAQARSVRYVVGGTIRRTADRLRISAQLYDAEADEVVWAERLDGQIDDVFDFQDRIAGAVVKAVSEAIGARLEGPSPRRYTPDSQAYDLYIQGRARRIPPTPQNLAAASQLFERAIARDPGFAGGYAGAAFTNVLRYGSCTKNCQSLIETAEEQARAAIRVDDSFGPAYGSLAEILYRRSRFAAATEAAERAVELSPNDALMRATLGRVLGHGSDSARGLELTREAQRMSPHSLPMLFYLGSLYRLDGQYEEAIEALRSHRAQLGGRIVPAPTTQLVAALVQAGRLDEAVALRERLLEVVPVMTVSLALRSFSFEAPEREAAFVDALVAAGLVDDRSP